MQFCWTCGFGVRHARGWQKELSVVKTTGPPTNTAGHYDDISVSEELGDSEELEDTALLPSTREVKTGTGSNVQ